MLGWAFIFLVLALISGALGFGHLAAISVEIAQLLFFLFIVLFVLTTLVYLVRGRRPPPPA